MKRLLLIRHAQTEPFGKGGDFDRGLTEQGQRDCMLMSQRLRNESFIPDMIMASDARRTLETASLLANHLDWTPPIISKYTLYQASFHTILGEIKSIGLGVNSLAIIAHNPGISDLVNRLANSPSHTLPPCGMELIQFDIDDWQEILSQKGILLWSSGPDIAD